MNEPRPIEEETKPTVGYPGVDGLQSSFLDNPQSNNRYGQQNQNNQQNEDGKLGIHDTIGFAEFVEALSRLSLITMQNVNAFTELKKIRVGLNFLIEYYVTVSRPPSFLPIPPMNSLTPPINYHPLTFL